jgi:hypothetical protein
MHETTAAAARNVLLTFLAATRSLPGNAPASAALHAATTVHRIHSRAANYSSSHAGFLGSDGKLQCVLKI